MEPRTGKQPGNSWRWFGEMADRGLPVAGRSGWGDGNQPVAFLFTVPRYENTPRAGQQKWKITAGPAFRNLNGGGPGFASIAGSHEEEVTSLGIEFHPCEEDVSTAGQDVGVAWHSSGCAKGLGLRKALAAIG